MKIIEYEYKYFEKADIDRRIGAFFIDILVFLPLIIIFTVIILRNYNSLIILALNIGITIIRFLYYMIMYRKYNATLGEKIFSLKLISTDNSKINIGQILKRILIPLFYDINYSFVNYIRTTFNISLENLRSNIMDIERDKDSIQQYFIFYDEDPMFNPVFVIISLLPLIIFILNIFVFFGKSRYRGIDDIIASTVLIKKKEKNANDT